MLTEKAAMYSTLGISKEVFAFGTKIEEELKERFAKIDEIAKYNQKKIFHNMQESMRLQRRFPEISARATNCFLLLENRTTPLRK